MFGISLGGVPWQSAILLSLLFGSWAGFGWLGRTVINAWLSGQFLHIREHTERFETLKDSFQSQLSAKEEVITELKSLNRELKEQNAVLLNLTRGVQQTATAAATTLAEAAVKERSVS